MTFLTGMLGIQPTWYRVNRDAAAASARTRSEKKQRDYAKVFSEPNTVKQAALTMGITHVGCLNQVHRYERRGLIKRIGKLPGFPRQIFFQWITE